VIVLSDILDHIIKLFGVFIIGVVLIAFGLAISNIAIATLGGLLTVVSALIMLIGVLVDRQ